MRNLYTASIKINRFLFASVCLTICCFITLNAQQIRFQGTSQASWDLTTSTGQNFPDRTTDSCLFVHNLTNNTASFRALTKRGVVPTKIREVFIVDNFSGTGTYPITSANCNETGFTCTLDSKDNGTLVITKYDTAAREIQGTFNFSTTCWDDINNKEFRAFIKNGKFWIKASGIKIIDPNFELLHEDGSIINDIDSIAKSTKLRSGAAADSITKLLLVAKSGEALNFRIIDSSSGNDNGYLGTISSNDGKETVIDAEPQIGSKDTSVIAVYTVPNGIGDIESKSRDVKIEVRKKSEMSKVLDTLTIQLFKPPVVLVHGMWSSPNAWIKDGFAQALEVAGFTVSLANYSFDNASTFDPMGKDIPGVLAVDAEIANVLNKMRKDNIAATRADLVGHSLGGLMSRSYLQQPNYRQQSNFQKGDVRRIITIGTPHHGSPLGPLLYDNRSTKIGLWTVDEIFGKAGMKIGPCHKDFTYSPSKSQGFSNLQYTDIKSHVIVSNALPFNSTRKTLFYDFINTIFNKTYDSLFSPDLESDLIVSEVSQYGGITPGAKNSTYFKDIGHSAPPAVGGASQTSSKAIMDEVIKLLNSKDSAGYFGDGFPKPVTQKQNNEAVLSEKPVAGAPAGDGTISFTSPKYGDIFKITGMDTLKISVNIESSAGIESLFYTLESNGIYQAPAVSPFSVNIPVTHEMQLGPAYIIAIARDRDGGFLIDSLVVNFTTTEKCNNLKVLPEELFFDDGINERALLVSGRFGDPPVFQDLSNSGTGTTYQTAKGNTIISVSRDGIVSAKSVGTDTITVSYSDLTVKVPVEVTKIISSVSQEEVRPVVKDKPSFTISPNPTSDYIEISGLNPPAKNWAEDRIRIYNALGEIVLTAGAIHELPLRIDVSGLPPGLYFLRLETQKEVLVIKILILR